MNFKFTVVFLVILVTGLNLVCAKSQEVSVTYYFSNDSSEFRSVDFSSVLLEINTDRDSLCKYSTSEGVSYNNMNDDLNYNSGKIHEKNLINIKDGVYNYYFKCKDNNQTNNIEPAELEITLRINSLVSAEISLSKDSPLKAGKVDVNLITSKIVSQAPTLSYSFDRIIYNKLPLFGSEKNWKTYLIIPKDLGESVISFKFSGTDLEGRVGEDVTTGGVFMVDTIKPSPIYDFNAIGYQGQIELQWHYDEDSSSYNVYRSSSPNSDYTNFYKSVDKSPFYDVLVEKGKTYYYRVTAVDKAGNEGDLSKEVYATVLLETSNVTQYNGLDLRYIGNVDNFLSEVDSLKSEIDGVSGSIPNKGEKEKNVFLNLKLKNQIDSAKTELNSLRNDAEKYKSQDLTKEELNKKLDAVRLRLEIIKKEVPEDITILAEGVKTEENKKEDIEIGILQIDSTISSLSKDKSLKESQNLIEKSKLKINSNFYVVEVLYLDGGKKDFSIVERNINAELEKMENVTFIETISKEVAGSVSEINVNDLTYNVIKEDPIISFTTDTKKIVYFVNKKLEIGLLKNNTLVLVNLVKESENSGSGITGYFSFILNKTEYFGIYTGFIIIAILLIYFFYLRKSKISFSIFKISKKIDIALSLIKKGKVKKAKRIYESLKKSYNFLNKKEKEKIYPKIDLLRNQILIFDLLRGLEKLEKVKDEELFRDLVKVYDHLSEENKKEISPFFEKIRKDFGGGNEE